MKWSRESLECFAQDRQHDHEAEEAAKHENMVVLTSWAADNGFSAQEIADMVEKPWHYLAELADARAALEAER